MPFPVYSHSLASNFTGPNEDPISEGGNWASMSGYPVTARRISNQLGGNADFWLAIWQPTQPAGIYTDVEVIIPIATWDGTNNTLDCMLRINDSTYATRDGYIIRTVSTTESVIEVVTNNSASPLNTGGAVAWATGDSIGLQAIGSTISLWRKPGAGAWAEVLSATNATYTSGRIGVGAFGTTMRFDDVTIGVASSGSSSPRSMMLLGVG